MVEKYTLPNFFNKMIRPKPSVVYDTYWRFAAERQSVFFKRFREENRPWTEDRTLNLYKFTNAYRVADRTSQYLIREVIYNGDQSPQEVLFRIMLFKLFNKIETWNSIKEIIPEIRYDYFTFDEYVRILDSLKSKGKAIYSGAYIMASGRSAFGYSLKHENHLSLLKFMMDGDFADLTIGCKSMEELYNLLKGYPTIGSFLAYQYATDINYSNLTKFSEMEFVKAGPGAKDGIRKCFTTLGDYSEEDVIKMMADLQHLEFERLEIRFQDLWGRSLQLIDCQNLFCEVDKYSRMVHPQVYGISKRTRIKQKFIPTSFKKIEYTFPEKWNLRLAEQSYI